jgi:putative N6-adenine-specific DNA methylase
MEAPFQIFLATQPGLEPFLAAEAREAGFADVAETPGGVTCAGGWPEVWRANLCLRGAGRVLARVAEFRVFHLAQLDKRARKVDWAGVLRPDVPLRIEVTTRKSKIYHAGAARDRIARAIAETLGVPLAEDAGLRLMVRIDDDLATFSLDTSGEPLHRRGLKQAVGKAPMRETMAALFLRACGYAGTEPVIDPMCGSGTFVIEAAEIAAGLAPGRARSFAFEDLATFDPAAWAAMRAGLAAPKPTDLRFHGADRDAGAIKGAAENAERAGVAALCTFDRRAISDLVRPEGPPGLMIVNPPYGARIGERKLLFGLYGALGAVARERLSGWRVGLITSDGGLARATGLPFLPPGPPVAHGGLTVQLHRTAPLP